MKICPSCGAPNDPANRFCDQCGARLEEVAPPVPVGTPAATAPVAAVCPACGAPVLPGEAFCDNCGADLTALAVAPVAPALTAVPVAAPAAAPAGQVICAVCGATALPGERYCDNCGADLLAQINAAATAPSAPSPVTPDGGPALANGAELPAPEPLIPPVPVEAPPAEVPPIPAPVEVPPPAGAPTLLAAEAPTLLAAEAPPAEVPPAPAPLEVPPPAEAPTVPAAEAPTLLAAEAPTVPAAEAPTLPAAEAPTVPAPVEAPAPEAPAAPAPVVAPAVSPPVEAPTPAEAPTPPSGAPLFDRAAYETRRAELTATISRQQQIIAQLEQMQATFGPATPPAVITGLAEAREALTRAETELAALEAPAPAVDPAEVRRLQDEIARQQQIIAQLEQMQATFGPATPPAVTTGLAEAREALAHAEAALAALGVAPAPAAPAPAVAAPPPPAPTGPRLIVEESGVVLPLPLDKTEIIIGREDPVSNIFPEIDLTPHGGELGGVSRQHARLSRAGGQWTLTDLNSTNYTRLNGVRLEPNVPTPISDGARVQFGRVVVIVHLI